RRLPPADLPGRGAPGGVAMGPGPRRGGALAVDHGAARAPERPSWSPRPRAGPPAPAPRPGPHGRHHGPGRSGGAGRADRPPRGGRPRRLVAVAARASDAGARRPGVSPVRPAPRRRRRPRPPVRGALPGARAGGAGTHGHTLGCVEPVAPRRLRLHHRLLPLPPTGPARRTAGALGGAEPGSTALRPDRRGLSRRAPRPAGGRARPRPARPEADRPGPARPGAALTEAPRLPARFLAGRATGRSPPPGGRGARLLSGGRRPGGGSRDGAEAT